MTVDTTAGTTTPSAVEAYVAAVITALDDLPAEDRADLTEDLAAQVAEAASESAGPIEERLGEPGVFAAELRSAAGLPPRGTRPHGALRVLHTAALTRRAVFARRRLQSYAWYREVVAFLPELRPGWWVLRGYVVSLGIGMATTPWNRRAFPLPRVLDSSVIGLATVIAVVTLSVRWGRRASRRNDWLRRLTIAGNIAVVILAVQVFQGGFVPRYAQTYYVDAGGPKYGYGDLGHGVTNIYPYDRDGRPLDGVLLYDQNGRPLSGLADSTASGLPLRRNYPLTVDGEIVTNLFPYDQSVVDPASGERIGREDRPDADIPRLAKVSPTPDASPSPSPSRAKPRPASTARPSPTPSG